MKQVMKGRANIIETGGNNWMWALAGCYSVARAAIGYVLTRKHTKTGRRHWIWPSAGFNNITRAGGK